jgi:drug/metabolite transporter (DMT)-like permease
MEWRVHLDRYDPASHPLMHIADDAPLLLMIGSTFVTLLMDTRSPKNTVEILKEQTIAWQSLILAGFAMGLIGTFILLHPFTFFTGILSIVVPLSVTFLGAVIVWRGIRIRPSGENSGGRMILGLGIMLLGAILFFLPVRIMAGFLCVVLAIWTFSSALLSMKRLRKGRTGVPSGFYLQVVLTLLSLVLAVLLFLAPHAALAILIGLVALLILLLGVMLVVQGASLMRRMRGGQ